MMKMIRNVNKTYAIISPANNRKRVVVGYDVRRPGEGARLDVGAGDDLHVGADDGDVGQHGPLVPVDVPDDLCHRVDDAAAVPGCGAHAEPPSVGAVISANVKE